MTKYGPSYMVDPESVRVVYGGFWPVMLLKPFVVDSGWGCWD
jgi:hypothetical protein